MVVVVLSNNGLDQLIFLSPANCIRTLQGCGISTTFHFENPFYQQIVLAKPKLIVVEVRLEMQTEPDETKSAVGCSLD